MAAKKLMQKINVLAVDDQSSNLIAIEAVLADEFNIIEAHSGEEALSILATRDDIHVILMDILMPHMDGYECATRIKQIAGCEEIPIIFITAIYKEDPYIRKGYQVGAVDYFSKPFDPEILKMKVGVYGSFRQKSNFLRERESHLKETEELIKTGRQLSAVLETLPVGVLISDDQGHIFQINEEVSRIFNTDEDSADTYGKVLGWWDSNGVVLKTGPLARALKKAESSHDEILQIQCLDGELKTILVSSSPLRGQDNRIVGAVIVIKDITQSKKIEEDLESRIARLVSLGLEIEQIAQQ